MSRETTAYKLTSAGVEQGKNALQSAPGIKRKARTSRRRLRKVQGRFQKAYTPTSSDPTFNHQAAQNAFDLVMKMDDDTATMFTTIVVSSAFEDDINNNLETIQKALNQVFSKRATQLREALIKSALNSPPEELETFGKAYSILEEISKAPHTPQFYGYDWDPSDFRRDPGSGRFMVKVKHPTTHPLTGQQELTVVGRAAPDGMTRAQKAQFQDEYRQVASFLSGITGIGQAGDTDVVYHLQDQAGNNFTHVAVAGTTPPTDILEDPNTRLVAMEAKPKTLTAGGAAYGLMGGMSESGVGRVNDVFKPTDQHAQALATKFSGDWANAGSPGEQNRRLFDRLNASGTFLNQAALPGSKAQLAGKFAQVVGQYGPEAERVIGPSARRTAYRYRGTERAPDEDLVGAYGREIQDAKKYGVTEAQADKRMLGFGTRREMARGDFTSMGNRRVTGAREVREQERVPSIHQMGQERAQEAQLMIREPSWAERGMGSAITAEYLRRRLPDKHLYKLHMAAGNTPPSEGVIINDQGQLSSQAVGYGDDHYLPFNLKNLKDLKGGEYIRSRSVGGLTAEDVYTGLVTGARRVTVVSRSGTFQMEFEPDFRGGRRHNDKAKRMTARYEALLDAVQSGQVDRQQVPKRWKDEIKAEVLSDEYFSNARKEVQQDEIENRIKEFKENPKIDGRDEERAEAMSQRFEERAARGEVSEQDAKDYRAQVFNELYNMKEVRFRLNGIGYEAALKSLQEQFPYYIKDVKTRPTRDEELLEFTLDDGYVEPGRVAPTKANAGYYGTKENAENQTGFLSASRTNYQRGKATKAGFTPAQAATPAAAATSATGAGNEENRRRQQLNDMLARENASRDAADSAVRLRQDIRLGVGDDNFVGGNRPAFMVMDDDRFRVWLNESPDNLTNFNRFLEDNAERWSNRDPNGGGIGGFPEKYERYKSAMGKVQPNPYDRSKAAILPANPYTFEGPVDPGGNRDEENNAYHSKARPAEIQAELRRLDRATTLLTTRTNLSDLTDDQMRAEIGRLDSLRRAKAGGQTFDELMTGNRQYSPDAPSPSQLEPIFKDDESMATHLDKIHQSRYLRSMLKQANVPPPAQPARGRGPSAGGGGGAGGAAPTPTPTPTGPTTPPRGLGGPQPPPGQQPGIPNLNPPGGGGLTQPNAPSGRLQPVPQVVERRSQDMQDAIATGAAASTKLHRDHERAPAGQLKSDLRELREAVDHTQRRLHVHDYQANRGQIADFIIHSFQNEDLRNNVLSQYGMDDLIPVSGHFRPTSGTT